jgi:hypothetical protein
LKLNDPRVEEEFRQVVSRARDRFVKEMRRDPQPRTKVEKKAVQNCLDWFDPAHRSNSRELPPGVLQALIPEVLASRLPHVYPTALLMMEAALPFPPIRNPRGRPRTHSLKEMREMKRLHNRGVGLAEIAEQFACSSQYVVHALKRFS